MPPSPLIKFANRTRSGDGRSLYWDRAAIDGLPYRGEAPPMLTEDEYEARAVRIADAQNGYFDTLNPEENKVYLAIVEACCNGWFQCLHIERFWQGTTKHYVEWTEYYMEDGTRAPYRNNSIMEVGNGQRNGAGHPHQGPF